MRPETLPNIPPLEREEQWVAPNYRPLPVVLTKGKGCWVWDIEGKRYLDMVSAYSAVSHGHCHPRLVEVMTHQASQLAVCSRAFYSDQLGNLAEKLCKLAGFERMLPMNTGAEAVETAIKAARRWGYESKGVPDLAAEIIVAENNFHGRTTTLVSMSTESAYRYHFGPFTPGFKPVPFGDISALSRTITSHTVAILLEPMQGEAGILMPPSGYLKAVREIANAHNILLILDEIQTGLGRTGKLFAFQHEEAKPDGLILGKALGGGLLPVSAFLSSAEVLDHLNPGSHGSTFGGNPLACRVALEALTILEEENYAGRSYEMGAYFKKQLQALKHRSIKDLRGCGLWLGLDLDPHVISARDFVIKLKDKGVLCKDTHDTVVRLAPPLIITKEEIDFAVKAFEEVFSLLGT